ncbi:MAG: SEL1-like repeat protein [Planctomycetes bacterium]|nr:SEL1-like repeat protein [Planctomycetota bacterium]MCA8936887.1 SEL1-like repeat protein [Planctomycetota bacterium]
MKYVVGAMIGVIALAFLMVAALVIYETQSGPEPTDIPGHVNQIKTEAGENKRNLPVNDDERRFAEQRALKGVTVAGYAGAMPLCKVPNYSGVGLEKVNLLAWLSTYATKAGIPQNEAHYRIGLIHGSGAFGARQDLSEARFYFKQASDAGHREAAGALTELNKRLSGG